MLRIDLAQINQARDTFFSRTDMGYLIFMIIGIIGYFTVPSIANHIMWVGGGEALTGKATSMAMGAATGAVSAGASSVSGGAGMMSHGAQVLGNTAGGMFSGAGKVQDAGNHFIKNKLSGND